MITPTGDNTFSPHQKKKKEKNLPTFIPSIASSSRFYLAEKSPINRGYSTPFKFNRKTEREITILPYIRSSISSRSPYYTRRVNFASFTVRYEWLRARLWPEEGWKRRGACITMRGDRGSPAVYHVSWQEAAHDGEERARKRYAQQQRTARTGSSLCTPPGPGYRSSANCKNGRQLRRITLVRRSDNSN